VKINALLALDVTSFLHSL